MIVKSRDINIGGIKFKSAPIEYDDDKIIMWNLIDLKIADLITTNKKLRQLIIKEFKSSGRYEELLNSNTHIASILNRKEV